MSTASQFLGGQILYWVSGTTYAQGDVRRSPTDHQIYCRIVAGAGATDPASDSTNWRPDGARAVKSIQRGESTPATGATTTDVTISSVDVNKATLSYDGGQGVATVASTQKSVIPRLSLVNSTTLRLSHPNASINDANSPPTVAWQIVETY